MSEHFAHVSLLERDRLPQRPGPRKGVPQGRHMHILMARGRLGLKALVPKVGAALAAAGVRTFDFAQDTRLWLPAGWMPRFRSQVEVYACSRDLLEWVLRSCVLSRRNIEVVTNTRVVGLVESASGKRVAGVRLPTGTLDADLVIDASGRGSLAPQWLRELGCEVPSKTVVEAPINYASRWYERPAGFEADWRLLGVSPRYPDTLRSGTIYQVEDRRWNVLLLGLDGEEVPTDEQGFLAFAGQLATPELRDALEGARPSSPIRSYRNNHNRVWHFERLEDPPQGFIVLGDAACALNPYFGLGMTSATLAALALREQFRYHEAEGDWADFTTKAQACIAAATADAWNIATNQHLRWPVDMPEAGRPPLGWYVHQLTKRAVEDVEVARTLLQVMHMLAQPAALFTPEIQSRVHASADRPTA